MAGLLALFGEANGGTLEGLRWIGYWTSPTIGAPITAVLAGIAGATVVCSQRAVFSTGVMAALALVPGMAIVGAALALGEPATAAQGLIRWLIDAACVLAAGGVVSARNGCSTTAAAS